MDEPQGGRPFSPQEKMAAALVAAINEMPEVGTDSRAKIDSKKGAKSSFSYQYASLQSILRAVRPVLAKHGLAVVQMFDGDTLQTTLVHSGGAMMTSPGAPCAGDAVDVREWGKRATYARRYAICALLGLAPDKDVDGAPAQPAPPPQAPPPTEAQPPADAPPEEVVIERIEKGFRKLNITKEEQADLWTQYQYRPDDLLLELLDMARREKAGREPGQEG